MTIWKDKLKTKFFILVDYSYELGFFNIKAIGQKYLSIYPPSFFNIHRVIAFPNISRYNFSVDYAGFYKLG